MDGQRLLKQAIDKLKHQYATVSESRREGWCQRYTRNALAAVGLRVPRMGTAIEAYRVLAADPAKYGWRRVTHAEGLPRFVLAYYGGCGKLPDGRFAGHTGIWDTADGILYSATQDDPADFAEYLKGAFVPS